jgi:4-alpha-glucanotransferase
MGFEEVIGRERASLVLLHPTSLPDPKGQCYGVGELGSEAIRFVDRLADAGVLAWQVLPLGHTGYKDSPYQTFSRCAGSPLMISVERLLEAGDLTPPDHDAYCAAAREAGLGAAPAIDPDSGSAATHGAMRTDYGWLFEHKIGANWREPLGVLRRAYLHFVQRAPDDPRRRAFGAFRERHGAGQAAWLGDYADYMAIKEMHGQRAWNEWAEPYRGVAAWRHARADLLRDAPSLASTIGFFEYLQFVFFEQWDALRRHARERGRLLIGDIPWYVGYDSADVWARREAFDLDEEGRPIGVAGVPPDDFSATGQLWGNPLYRWRHPEAMRWWADSLGFLLDMVDLLRLDHFRAVDTYWVVPREQAERDGTAMGGYWEKGPGTALLEAIRSELARRGRLGAGGQLPLIAEDLGCFDPLRAAREAYPDHVAPHRRYSLSLDFAALLSTADPVLGKAFDPETGEYSTRIGVSEILRAFDLPWMGVLQFAYQGADIYLPERMPPLSVTYTGTHDNDTTLGWYAGHLGAEREEDIRSGGHARALGRVWRRVHLSRERFQRGDPQWTFEQEAAALAAAAEAAGNGNGESLPDGLREPLAMAHHLAVERDCGDEREIVRTVVESALWSHSCLAGAPMQDLLLLGNEARMNRPGDAEGQWWAWRATADQMNDEEMWQWLREIDERYGRLA